MNTPRIHVFNSIIITIVVTALTGAIIFQGMKRYYIADSYKSELARARVNLEALKHLDEGHVKQAIEVLELDLQSSALMLDVDSSNLTDGTYRKIVQMREQIKDYQTRNK